MEGFLEERPSFYFLYQEYVLRARGLVREDPWVLVKL